MREWIQRCMQTHFLLIERNDGFRFASSLLFPSFAIYGELLSVMIIDRWFRKIFNIFAWKSEIGKLHISSIIIIINRGKRGENRGILKKQSQLSMKVAKDFPRIRVFLGYFSFIVNRFIPPRVGHVGCHKKKKKCGERTSRVAKCRHCPVTGCQMRENESPTSQIYYPFDIDIRVINFPRVVHSTHERKRCNFFFFLFA